MNHKLRLPVILATVTVVASGLLMGSNELTREVITKQKQQMMIQSLSLLMPAQLYDNDVLSDELPIYEPHALGHRQPMTMYLGYQGNKLSVVAVPVVARNGYAGDIEILVGIREGGVITAVEVVAHKETPGLGDLVERRKGNWLSQFVGRDIQYPQETAWRVKKDGGQFDQITGATITPRAIVQAVKKALLYYQNNHTQWQNDINQESQPDVNG